ncbi:MAG TPA: hypothetical protein VH374_07780 [Polyangia bacterium]|jgi:hypothetical protein|nr:hypothetical protein [Polyangia bacterium]
MQKITGFVALLFALAFANVALANKTTVEVDKVKDKSLLASFSDSQLICDGINSSVDVHWNNSVVKQDGTKSDSSALIVDFRYTNSCTGDDITMSGFLSPANGNVADDLSHGHLDGVVTVSTDPDLGPPFLSATLTVNINLTANGPATKFHDKSKSKDGGVITISDFSESARPGVATGTVNGTIPLMAGPKFLNLINGPSLTAQLGKDANGTITITKKTK